MRYGVYVQNFGEYGDPHNLIALALDANKQVGMGSSSGTICCSTAIPICPLLMPGSR